MLSTWSQAVWQSIRQWLVHAIYGTFHEAADIYLSPIMFEHSKTSWQKLMIQQTIYHYTFIAQIHGIQYMVLCVQNVISNVLIKLNIPCRLVLPRRREGTMVDSSTCTLPRKPIDVDDGVEQLVQQKRKYWHLAMIDYVLQHYVQGSNLSMPSHGCDIYH